MFVLVDYQDAACCQKVGSLVPKPAGLGFHGPECEEIAGAPDTEFRAHCPHARLRLIKLGLYAVDADSNSDSTEE